MPVGDIRVEPQLLLLSVVTVIHQQPHQQDNQHHETNMHNLVVDQYRLHYLVFVLRIMPGSQLYGNLTK